jgi:hypothetical protein
VTGSFDQIYCLSLQVEPSGAAALRFDSLGAPPVLSRWVIGMESLSGPDFFGQISPVGNRAPRGLGEVGRMSSCVGGLVVHGRLHNSGDGALKRTFAKCPRPPCAPCEEVPAEALEQPTVAGMPVLDGENGGCGAQRLTCWAAAGGGSDLRCRIPCGRGA